MESYTGTSGSKIANKKYILLILFKKKTLRKMLELRTSSGNLGGLSLPTPSPGHP